MLIALLRAILGGLLLGPVVTVLTIPILIVATALSTIAGFVIAAPAALIPGGPILAALAGFAVSLGTSAFVLVQSARYAGSITGLQPLTRQPPFKTAFWDCVLIIIMLQIALGLVAAIVVTAAIGIEELGNLNTPLVKGFDAASIEATGPGLVWLIFLCAGAGAYVVILLVVPRACLTEPAPRAYGIGLLLARFLIAVPIYTTSTLIACLGMAALFATGPGLAQQVGGIFIFFGVVLLWIFLLNGFLLAFEARLLAVLRDRRPAVTTHEAESQSFGADYRALREEWAKR